MAIDGAGQGPRNAPNGRAGVILVSLYSWTAVTLGVAITRFTLGLIHKVDFGLDDCMVLCGSVLYTASTVSWQFAVSGGLGKRFVEVSSEDASQYFKSVYAAQLLQIAAMASAKLSSAFLVERVAPQCQLNKSILFGGVALFTVYSLFAFAFQCGTPDPWILDPPACGQGGPLYAIIALNIVTDLGLAAWIFPILRHLNMDKERRTTVAILFGSRAVVPLAAAVQIWTVTVAAKGTDPTRDIFELALLSQAVTSLSLIVASLPRVKRFLGVAGSGLMDARIPDREIARSNRASSSRADSVPLRLIPSNSAKFTTTIMSGESKGKDKEKQPAEWQKFVSMGRRQDEHTSVSSLCEHQEGVIKQQDVTVMIENSNRHD